MKNRWKFKRKLSFLNKYINGTNGVISLFLAILMVPFASIAGVLGLFRPELTVLWLYLMRHCAVHQIQHLEHMINFKRAFSDYWRWTKIPHRTEAVIAYSN